MKKILIIILILIFGIVALAAALFSDGFESGDLTAWDASATDSGDLSATEAAALHGTYGLDIFIDGTGAIYVQDDTPAGETRYRARFYIDPNGLTMGDGDNFVCFRGYKAAGDVRNLIVLLRYTIAAGYKIQLKERTDANNYSAAGTQYVITDEPHCVEFDWEASSGANDGWFSLWIDGVFKETVAGIDNDTHIMDYIRLGAPGDLDAGTENTFFIDDFASNDDGSEIGLISEVKDNAILFGINF